MAITSVNSTRSGRIQFQGLFGQVWEVDAIYDAPSVNSNGFESESISAPGVDFGDFVIVSFAADLGDLLLTAHVDAVDSININLFNPTSGAVNRLRTITRHMSTTIKSQALDFAPNNEHKDYIPARPQGRPAGSKNKSTMFAEIVAKELEQHFLDNAKELAEATFKDAIENDGQSRKIVSDRLMPVKKATDMDGTGVPLVNITIKGIEPVEIE